MINYDRYKITETLPLDRNTKHLLVELRQSASTILWRRDYINISDKVFVAEFGGKQFILACAWRLMCDFGGLVEDESTVEHMLWWLYLVRNYPTTKKFQRHTTLMEPRHSRKHIKKVQHAFLRIKKYVVRYCADE